MAASETVEVFWGPNRAQFDKAVEILRRLSGVQVRSVFVADFFEDKVTLPFIQVGSGARYYGIDSIRQFVDKSLGSMEKAMV